jgi:lysozyme
VGACNELPRWTLAGGKELPGLVKRRAAERDLCLQGLR